MTVLPRVDFCGLQTTRLILGANPFGGYSHQSEARDAAMLSYHTVDRIHETWERAAQAGINTLICNNETPHVLQAVKEYLAAGGTLGWIAQLNCIDQPDMLRAIDEAVAIGARAVYFHGWQVDEAYRTRDETKIRQWAAHARQAGVPVGAAGHAPEAHLWVEGLEAVDFHCVCFFNCGSLHAGGGEHFDLANVFAATDAIRRIRKPCIGYKIMGAGRIEARMAFEYAFAHIKPGDAVNVGMHRGDRDDMVEANAALVREILEHQEAPTEKKI
jgi:hypothetical protein